MVRGIVPLALVALVAFACAMTYPSDAVSTARLVGKPETVWSSYSVLQPLGSDEAVVAILLKPSPALSCACLLFEAGPVCRCVTSFEPPPIEKPPELQAFGQSARQR